MNTKSFDTPNAVIYARVSSVGERQSTTRQVADLSTYAAANSLAVDKVFEEHISGAKANKDRPVLNECLSYCFDNHIPTLLISELSRLGRNPDEVLANIRLCKEHHLNVYFQKEGLSIYDRDGKINPYLTIMIAVLGTCALLERENTYYRLQSGKRLYIENGGKVGRKVGYRKSRDQKMEDYGEVLKKLRSSRRIPLRDIATCCGVSVSTVMRLKREFSL